MKLKDKEKALKTAFILLIVFSVISAYNKLFIGFDIDESYAVAMPFRMVKGDRLFLDMWEVHQTSSFLPYLLLRIYYAFTGSADYSVLYLRICALVIHALVSIYVYYAGLLIFKDKAKKDLLLLFAIGYFNFLPKWMMSVDFSMQQLWLFTFTLSFLILSKEIGWVAVLVTGTTLAMCVLAYPGMLFVFPFILYYVYKDNRRNVIYLILGCALMAIIFFADILRYMTLSSFISSIPKVFMDGSHQFNFSQKVLLFAQRWGEVLIQIIILAVPAAVLAEILFRIIDKKRDELTAKKRIFLFGIVFEAMWSAFIILVGPFLAWSPFRLQARYIVQFAVLIPLMFLLLNRDIIIIVVLQIVSFAGILITSNVGPASSASYLVVGNLLCAALLPVLGQKLFGSDDTHVNIYYISISCAILFIISLIMCKGFYMRNTEYVPGNILTKLSKVNDGPVAGIFVRENEAVRINNVYVTMREETSSDNTILFMGTDTISLLYPETDFSIPTSISTPAFNEQWVDYYEMYPDKMPDVIFIAKNTIDNREKFFDKNPFGIFLAENYNVSGMKETNELCILKR